MKDLPNWIESNLIEQFKSIFEVDRLEALARQTKFIERSTSQVSGQMFLNLNVLFEPSNSESSLNDMCDFLEDHFGVRIKKQSLDERFNKEAVSFMKACFSEVFSRTMIGDAFEPSKKFFSHVFITDTTAFKLPAALQHAYKGTGTNSGVKVAYTFDLTQGVCKHLAYGAASVHDADYLPEIEKDIVRNALYIKDLGFWQYKHFEKIHQSKAYFLTRYRTNTQVFGIKKSTSQILPILGLLPLADQGDYTCEGYMGAKERIPVRILIQKVPLEVVEARIKKAKHKAATQHTTIADSTFVLYHYNIYLTNAEEEKIPFELMQSVYSLRWQIELIFKAWKSVFELDKVKKMNEFRFECYLLGRLIMILLSTFTQNTVKQFLWEECDFELSEWKAHKVFKKRLYN